MPAVLPDAVVRFGTILVELVLLFGGRVAAAYASVVLPTTILLAAGWEAAGLGAHVKVGGGAHDNLDAPAPTGVGAATHRPGATATHAPAGAAAPTGGGTCASTGDTAGAAQGCDDPPGWRLGDRAPRSGARVPRHPPAVARPAAGRRRRRCLLYGVAPEATIARVAGDGTWLAVPIAALVGIPLYVRGEAALPIGYALLTAGAGVGPVFAMVVAAAGASLPEVMLLTGLFRRRLLVAFVASVLTVAVAAGYLIPFVA